MFKNIRDDFPQLQQKVRSSKFIYLDSAATTLIPKSVAKRIYDYQIGEVSNIHRGAHYFSNLGTQNYEDVRSNWAKWLDAKAEEVIFTKGTTEGFNLIASGLEDFDFGERNEFICSPMDHHSSLVPLQRLAQKRKFTIKFVELNSVGEIDQGSYQKLLSKKTALVSLPWVSNSLGTTQPIQQMFTEAKKMGALCLLDGAQALSLFRPDVQKLGCDFLCFSGHKVWGPFGVGVLYGRQDLLEQLPPYQSGGSMIEDVSFQSSNYLKAPHKFEAGTPNISGVLGLGAALAFMETLDFEHVRAHEKKLTELLVSKLEAIGGFEIYSRSDTCYNLCSFNLQDVHASDLGQLLDQMGCAVRTGHHCTQVLMKTLKINGTIRASMSVYNNEDDIEGLFESLKKAKDLLI